MEAEEQVDTVQSATQFDPAENQDLNRLNVVALDGHRELQDFQPDKLQPIEPPRMSHIYAPSKTSKMSSTSASAKRKADLSLVDDGSNAKRGAKASFWYTTSEKLAIMSSIERSEISVRDAAQKYGVTSRTIRNWQRKRSELADKSALANGKNVKMVGWQRYPKINTAAEAYVMSESEQGKGPLRVTWADIKAKAQDEARRLVELGDDAYADFKASSSWLRALLARLGLLSPAPRTGGDEQMEEQTQHLGDYAQQVTDVREAEQQQSCIPRLSEEMRLGVSSSASGLDLLDEPSSQCAGHDIANGDSLSHVLFHLDSMDKLLGQRQDCQEPLFSLRCVVEKLIQDTHQPGIRAEETTGECLPPEGAFASL